MPAEINMLLMPVPLMAELRKQKQMGYREIPIDTAHPLFDEPLVDIAEHGIAGQAYYSRPNSATGDPVPGVPTQQLLRKSVAEALAQINDGLRQPEITEFFGSEVELYVEDALRPVSLQKHLYSVVIPELLRKNHPEYTEAEIAERAKDIIAMPSHDPKKPSPHATGGVFDISLRYKRTDKGYDPDAFVPMGHISGGTSELINPDYFEYTELKSKDDRLAQRNRRAYYAIMTGAAFEVDTGLTNNPTEWWHWGRGDQLSAKVRGDSSAYYSLAETKK